MMNKYTFSCTDLNLDDPGINIEFREKFPKATVTTLPIFVGTTFIHVESDEPQDQFIRDVTYDLCTLDASNISLVGVS